jgi:hypothetical protein
MIDCGGALATFPMCCSGRSNRSKHGGRLPRLQGIHNQRSAAGTVASPTAPELAPNNAPE